MELSSEILEETVRHYIQELKKRPTGDPIIYLDLWKKRVPGREVQYIINPISNSLFEGDVVVKDEYGNLYEWGDNASTEEEIKEILAEEAIGEFIRYDLYS